MTLYDFPYHMLDDIQYMEQRMLEEELEQSKIDVRQLVARIRLESLFKQATKQQDVEE